MFAIFTRELQNFFSSLSGYIAAMVFLVVTGLILWVFPGNLNILDGGYASLNGYFSIAPWVLLLLVPAATMRTFSDEKRFGTLELILTRPISDGRIVLGKFFATLVLVLIVLVPSLVYYLSVYLLSSPIGNIDAGGTWGSFIGLFLLASTYASVGIFTSSLTDNAIVSFLLSVLFCLFLFSGLSALASLPLFSGVKPLLMFLSISEHYASISRGVLDSRDLVYFISMIFLFIIFTRTVLESRKW
ncbi:MAG TPA: gliding motility-associated ABC transporter permease subunit GldF [Tenuifilaceae bacterium]|nr:gliding motility-associated ABC transporter permease subunit GldF [Tenuifilaceae bacterium]HOC36920.1 gliding motility-associated ABC transporter permease subunit GldF [Tenuifilaceae bacterium]HOG72524.1 gliding motility-associated ABC transporter permease subunit GldF [Tenuifilaceae bacterium]HPA67770.1 gliding motility-associated ABC transporter permease subunit GldF [Tenuifilaceae bacterium]HPH00703.1 gliding motility-associated ABC transporter permease subunit GldF [Tenuifilaceae bacteri